MSFTIDLGSSREIVGLRLRSGAYRRDTPRGLRVEGADEEGTWRVLANLAHPYPGVTLRDGTVHLEPHATVEVRFEPASVRDLRLVQTGSDPLLDWSITEVEVLGAGDR